MTHHHRDSGAGIAACRRGRHPDPRPPDRAGPVRAGRRALAGATPRQDLRPARRPVLAARRCPRGGRGAGLPDAALRRGRRPHPAHARAHARLGELLRRGRRPAARVRGRPLAGPGQVWSLAATQWTYTGSRAPRRDDPERPGAAGPRARHRAPRAWRSDGPTRRRDPPAQPSPPGPHRPALPGLAPERAARPAVPRAVAPPPAQPHERLEQLCPPVRHGQRPRHRLRLRLHDRSARRDRPELPPAMAVHVAARSSSSSASIASRWRSRPTTTTTTSRGSTSCATWKGRRSGRRTT